jgi:cephalosporin-C deacetylase-like acetyl esterase
MKDEDFENWKQSISNMVHIADAKPDLEQADYQLRKALVYAVMMLAEVIQKRP